MSALRRLATVATASVTASAVVVSLVATAPPAYADPCSVPKAGPSARTTSPLPKLPILHLPIGRKPAILDGVTSTPEAAKNSAVAPDTAAKAAAAPTATTATNVGWVTGPETSSYSDFTISGADLGITWDNGATGANKQVLIAFGDTFGDCSKQEQDWRKNTLFRSSDSNLSNGMTVPPSKFDDKYASSPVLRDQNHTRPNFSRQIIGTLGLAATEVTIIPTAGISVGTRQYVNFMSVSQWGNAGQWSTNFSAIAVSDDNGETWQVPRSSIRPSWFNTVPGIPFVWGYQNFQMGAFVRSGGYVYSYGTGAGRGGMPFLSRVSENSVADVSAYEYYTPFGWLKNVPFLAVQVVWAPGSEMSVAWNDYLRKFVMLYTNTLNDVVLRTADKPEGPWSSAATIVKTTAVPGGIYAPYIHPWSSGSDLYFTLSLWSTYGVMLMRTKLAAPPAG